MVNCRLVFVFLFLVPYSPRPVFLWILVFVHWIFIPYALFSKKLNLLPSPGELSAWMLPPCASINSLLMASPSPVPLFSTLPGTLK